MQSTFPNDYAKEISIADVYECAENERMFNNAINKKCILTILCLRYSNANLLLFIYYFIHVFFCFCSHFQSLDTLRAPQAKYLKTQTQQNEAKYFE